MSIELNRIIIPARSKWGLGHLPRQHPRRAGRAAAELVVPVKVSNGVTLSHVDAERFDPHHCAFPATPRSMRRPASGR